MPLLTFQTCLYQCDLKYVLRGETLDDAMFLSWHYTLYTQTNGAVSKVNEKFISHLTLAQRTPSAAATVQVSNALPAVRFSCLLRGQFPRWCVFSKPCRKITLHRNHRSGHLKTEHTESLFLLRRHLGNWLRRPAGASFLNRARNSRCTVITDLDTSKRSTQKAFSCRDAVLETGPAVSMRSELLVAHEKLGQLPLLTVYVVPV